MTRICALLVAAALTTNCAAAAYQSRPPWGGADSAAPHTSVGPAGQDPPSVTAAYVRQLPIGAAIKIRLTDGQTLKGDLMIVRDGEIVVRPRTRIPVPSQTIPFERMTSVEIQRNGGVGRAIAVGAAVGAAAAIGVFLALFAAIAD